MPASCITSPKCLTFPWLADLAEDSLLKTENSHRLFTLCSSRLSSHCSSWHKKVLVARKAFWMGGGASYQLWECARKEKGKQSPKWISCKRLETLTSQFILDGCIIVIYCILRENKPPVCWVYLIYCTPIVLARFYHSQNGDVKRKKKEINKSELCCQGVKLDCECFIKKDDEEEVEEFWDWCHGWYIWHHLQKEVFKIQKTNFEKNVQDLSWTSSWSFYERFNITKNKK